MKSFGTSWSSTSIAVRKAYLEVRGMQPLASADFKLQYKSPPADDRGGAGRPMIKVGAGKGNLCMEARERSSSGPLATSQKR